MNATKGNWLFSLLWINSAVAIVMFIRVITSPPPAMRDLLFELAYSFLFANPVS
jgi:hypothetical protein